jgi:23S rRNA (guanosine2251-2'-O)-methyltransferase
MHIPVSRVQSLESAVDYLKKSGLKIVSLDEKASAPCYHANLSGPLALVMGSEETGIRQAILKKSDLILRIPTTGKTGSLNVSAAAAVIMSEVSRQRYPAA